MTLVDSLIDKNAGVSFGQSFDAGTELAQRSQQLQQQQQQLQIAQQQQQMQKQNYLLSNYTKAINTEDPGMKKVLLDHVQKVGEQWQMPLHDDMYALAQKSEDWKNQWNAKYGSLDKMNPTVRQQMITSGVGILGNDVGEAAKALDSITRPQEDVLKAQMQSAAFGNRLAISGQIARLKDIQQKATTAGAPADILARIAQGDETAVQEATPFITKYNQQVGGDKHDNTRDEIRHRSAMEDIAQQRVDKTNAMLALRGKQLNLSQTRLLNTVENQIENKPAVKNAIQSIQFADTALDRLKPGMKWIDMNDVAADYNRLITGTNRAAFAGEDRRTFTSFKGDFDKLMGKASNNEQGGPTDTEINLFRDRVEAMKDAYTRQHDNVYKRAWQGRAATGVVPQGIAAAHFEANKLSEDSQWDMKAGSPAISNQKKPTQLNPNPGPTPAPVKTPSAAFLDQVTKQIPDPQLRNAWLKSKGYQLPGGQ